jgi:DNA primase
LYDGDAAGIKAALRGIDLLLEEGMNIKVVLLPTEKIPTRLHANKMPVSLPILFNKMKPTSSGLRLSCCWMMQRVTL